MCWHNRGLWAVLVWFTTYKNSCYDVHIAVYPVEEYPIIGYPFVFCHALF